MYSQESYNSESEDSCDTEIDVKVSEPPNKKRKYDEISGQGLSSMMFLISPPSGFEKTMLLEKKEPEVVNKKNEQIRKKIDKINKTKQGPVNLVDNVLESKLPIELKARLVAKLEDPFIDRSDKSKMNTWVSQVLKLPIGIYRDLNVRNMNNFLLEARKKLDNIVYGMENTKEEIMDFLVNYISSPDKTGTVLALQGPKGVGKTRLCRALSEILTLPLFQISMGGLTDSSILLGHDSTYIGSKCGKIGSILQQAKCMNFILYIDEMDKTGAEGKSKDIQGVLTHLLDETQNKEFQDLYFDGIPLDLSRVLFITSFNDPELIDPIVLNRMKVLNIKKLNIEEKINITKNYILPEINHNLFVFDDDILRYIVVHKTAQEEGMRNIKKNMETIVNRLNTIKILSNCENKKDISRNFSYLQLLDTNEVLNIVTKKMVNILLGDGLKKDEPWMNMYV
jgi:ATP-dependent Lon protease